MKKAEVERLQEHANGLERDVARKNEQITKLKRDLQDETNRANRERANAERLAPYAIGWCRIKDDQPNPPADGMYIIEGGDDPNEIGLFHQFANEPWRSGARFFYGPIPKRDRTKKELQEEV